ncbi:ATP-binding cassette domain-containing protein [Georgenia satyanarayanai]|uniref:ATP-binding cassette domain-containing protein n=1 Tax=Georgenia satyanarayanai TaxID=860221 RepID=UPI00203C199D|nr:ATP-binding cassette domain-containing protein [Georgenia satyanarayanai]MCM3661183.1 ATP-binding cassette domain-containing protein [Georgenia satyanarayanai]
MITAEELTFRYGQHEALRGVSGTWGAGVVGALGANGAGKTTLLRVLAGIAAPSGGRLTVDGVSVTSRADRSRLRAQVGFLPQAPRWLPELTVAEFVTYFGRLRMGRQGVDAAVCRAVEAVGLEESRDVQLGHLSGGQRQRAFIAQAIVHSPRILILDEPSAGLDPRQRIRLRGLLATLAADRLVLISTHLVEDLQQFASHILVLNEGRALWQGSFADLQARGKRDRSEEYGLASDAEAGFLSLIGGAVPLGAGAGEADGAVRF